MCIHNLLYYVYAIQQSGVPQSEYEHSGGSCCTDELPSTRSTHKGVHLSRSHLKPRFHAAPSHLFRSQEWRTQSNSWPILCCSAVIQVKPNMVIKLTQLRGNSASMHWQSCWPIQLLEYSETPQNAVSAIWVGAKRTHLAKHVCTSTFWRRTCVDVLGAL